MKSNFENEQWKELFNSEKYFISNYGRVKSVRKIKKTRTILESLLKTYEIQGFLYAFGYIDGKRVTICVHREVAKAFVPNLNNYNFIKHINLNQLDNRSKNLKWIPKKKTKEYVRGLEHGKTLFSFEQRQKILIKRQNGDKLIVLSMENNASISTISRIVKNKTVANI